VIEKMPILSMPLPDGGQVVCRVDAVIGATTNTSNDELTDVYVDVLVLRASLLMSISSRLLQLAHLRF
jgi:hypothetical protein